VDIDVAVTRHAEKRIHERLGLPKKAAQAEAERARVNGLHISATSGALRRYLDKLHHVYQKGADYRVMPSGIYVFISEVLVTVLPVPQNLRSRVMDAWKKRSEPIC
jgi:hypothetical protein